jgi:hypothetical protein
VGIANIEGEEITSHTFTEKVMVLSVKSISGLEIQIAGLGFTLYAWTYSFGTFTFLGEETSWMRNP